MAEHDAIIIGAGLNGLVAANYLAKAGKRVLVLERRAILGGQAATEMLGDGMKVDVLHAGGQLRPDIVAELALDRHGLPKSICEPLISMLPDGGQLRLSADAGEQTRSSIQKFSKKDCDRWPDFVAFMREAAGFLDAAYRTPMPRLPHVSMAEGWPLARLGLKLRGLGARDMFRVIRMLPMSALELTEEWFESDTVRAAIGAVAVHGATLGPMSAGGGYTLMHNWLNRGGPGHQRVEGGVGRIAVALVAALKERGGEVRASADVKKVLLDDHQRALGVELEGGAQITAPITLSAADPRHTLLDLVGAPDLPPEFVWHTQSIKMRGSVAKVHLLTDGDHGLPQGTLVIAPSVRYVERAFDAAKYGRMSTEPYLEITTNGPVVSIHFQFAPYALRDSEWSQERAVLERAAVDTAANAFPQLKSSIREVKSLTPLDLEQTYGLTEGDLNHGQLILDQMFFMRPMPGWSTHKTPVDNLYLCGSGAHGGGGISGAAGRNAAKAVLKRK